MKKLLFLFFLSFPVFADQVNGTFTPPTEREDGSTLTQAEIGGYKLYVDSVEVQSIPNTDTAFAIELTPGTYALNLTTVDTDGRESIYSNTLTQIIPARPNPPTGFTVTVTINIQGN
jgi:hypothetical protein